jgi:ADP-ribose pyrophosphatase YjhB (NUDIX family)
MMRAFQKYWRIARGLHLSVEACVLDEAGRILMIRKKDAIWELPSGRVRDNENVEMALHRVLHDDAGIEVNAKPELSFICPEGRSGQCATYLVRRWHTLAVDATRDISFFPALSLPAATSETAAERIRRSLEGRTTSEV